MSEHGSGCCGRCLSFILTSGFAALFLWLSLRTSNPTISLTGIYLPALNTSLNSSSNNHTVFFSLQLKNNMRDKGVHYSNTTLTFSFRNATTASNTSVIGNYTIPSFYQGHQKRAHRTAAVEDSAAHGATWDEARGAVANGSSATVGLRLDLVTKVKFKILVWYTTKHTLMLGADVAVNGSGTEVNGKGVKLKKSGAVGGGGEENCLVIVVIYLVYSLLL